MEPPFPSYTKVWHNATYAAISPSRPELSVAGKTIVITGAGTGIGRATALAFAQAGAAKISILARRENLLQETKKEIETAFPKTAVSVHPADVTDAKALGKAAGEIGGWDVLVLNAGYLSDLGSVLDSNVDDWWKGYEVNIKGAVLMLQAFMPNKKQHAAVVGVSSAVVTLPSSMMANFSSYVSSKMALVKLLEIFGAENPDVHVTILHPGVVKSDIYMKSGMSDIPTDDADLSAHFILWSVSPEASFINGKFMYINWDVDELKSKAKEIKETPVLTSNVLGWPWA